MVLESHCLHAKQNELQEIILFINHDSITLQKSKAWESQGLSKPTVARAQRYGEKQKANRLHKQSWWEIPWSLIIHNKASYFKWEAIAATISGLPHLFNCRLHRSILQGIQRVKCLISVLHMLCTGLARQVKVTSFYSECTTGSV